MFPFRLLLVLSLCGIALWGLFSLLENLRTPELLRSPRAVIVKGCDSPESDEARRLCSELRCQKALLDAREFPLDARFQTTVRRNDGERRLVGGTANVPQSAHSETFACVFDFEQRVAAMKMDPEELDSLAANPELWPRAGEENE